VIFADEDGAIDGLRARMRQAGYRPICASDAGDAIAAITHEKPALVLVHLGRSTRGRELLRRLDHSAALAQIPRVVIGAGSPLGSAGPARQAVGAGAGMSTFEIRKGGTHENRNKQVGRCFE
jgi:hypothetical protein